MNRAQTLGLFRFMRIVSSPITQEPIKFLQLPFLFFRDKLRSIP